MRVPAGRGRLRLAVFVQSLRPAVGQKSWACGRAVMVPAPRRPPAGGRWPGAQVLLSTASSGRLPTHLEPAAFWPDSDLRAVGLRQAWGAVGGQPTCQALLSVEPAGLQSVLAQCFLRVFASEFQQLSCQHLTFKIVEKEPLLAKVPLGSSPLPAPVCLPRGRGRPPWGRTRPRWGP